MTLRETFAAVSFLLSLMIATETQAINEFCLRHYQAGTILQNCRWDGGDRTSATCIDRQPGKRPEIRTVTASALANWEEFSSATVGCGVSTDQMHKRPRGDDEASPSTTHTQ